MLTLSICEVDCNQTIVWETKELCTYLFLVQSTLLQNSNCLILPSKVRFFLINHENNLNEHDYFSDQTESGYWMHRSPKIGESLASSATRYIYKLVYQSKLISKIVFVNLWTRPIAWLPGAIRDRHFYTDTHRAPSAASGHLHGTRPPHITD